MHNKSILGKTGNLCRNCCCRYRRCLRKNLLQLIPNFLCGYYCTIF